jgi:hypothetical protein
MVEILSNPPDLTLDNRITSTKLVNFITEEEMNVNVDIDQIKTMV